MNQKVQQILKTDKTLKDLSEGLHERISRYRREQREFDLQAILNRDFVMGQQWKVITDSRIIEPRRDEGEVRITANFIKKFYMTHASEILAKDIDWQVAAFEGDHRRIGVSDVGQQVLKKYYVRDKRAELLHKLMGAIDIDGIGYIGVDYYPNRGKPIGTYNDQQGQEKIVPSGLIEHRVVSSLDVLAPDRYDCSDKLPCMIEVVRMHVEEVKARWNLKDPPQASGEPELKERYRNVFGEDKDRDKEVEIFKCWFKSGNGVLPDTGKYGVGIGFIYCDELKEVLDIVPFPFPFDDYRIAKYPLIDMHCDRRMDHYHSNGIPVEQIPLQMQFNKSLSQVAEASAYMGSPIIRAVVGQFDSEDDIPTYAGGVMYYRPVPGSPAPDVVQMPPIPSVVENLSKLYEQLAGELHQIGKVQMANQEGSINSYSGLKLLREQASRLMAPFVTRWESGWATAGLVTLMIEQKYRDYPETLLLTDDAADRSVVYFTRADLASDMEVTVDAGVNSDSPADDLQKDVQMAQIGIVDKAILQKKYYGLDKMDNYKRQSRDAYNENEAMLSGQPAVNTDIEHLLGDDPAIHWDVHADVEKDQRYQALSPDGKNEIRKHKIIHWIAKNDQQTFIAQYVKPVLQQEGYLQQTPEPVPPQTQPTGASAPQGSAPQQGVA